MKVFHRMCPHHEDVVKLTLPCVWLVAMLTLLTFNLFLLNLFNLIVTVYEMQEKRISLKQVKPLNRMVLIKKDDLKFSTFLQYQLSMFKSFVLFIAAHYFSSGCNVFPNLKILNFFYVTFFHRYLLLSLVTQSFVLIYIFTCYTVFPIF